MRTEVAADCRPLSKARWNSSKKQMESPLRPQNIALILHSGGILQVQKNLSSDPKLPGITGFSFVHL